MLRWTHGLLVAATTTATTNTKDMSTKRVTTAPVVSPAVVRSLYRRLYKEVCLLDADPLAKFLFPQTKELQEVTGMSGPLYVPDRKYVDVLRSIFRHPATKAPKINLAFDTLNRLRAHRENVRDKLPALLKERMQLLAALRGSADSHRDLFRAEALPLTRPSENSSSGSTPRVVSGGGGGAGSLLFPARVVLGDAAATTPTVELSEGVVLVAHPLSSTHVDRRVMMITERTALMTTAVVLDLQFTYPLSRGNPMFPEVFWGHDVYDGGFSQIGFTMPPTAHITLLHTLEPTTAATASSLSEEQQPQGGGDVAGASQYLSWRKWREAAGKDKTSASSSPPSSLRAGASGTRGAATPVAAEVQRQHELLCRPLIPSKVLRDGTREPTLYLSRVEALPYLAKLAMGQPRSSLRVYWGSMRWTTAQIEHEVANGHWIAVRVSPSFFRAYDLVPETTTTRHHPSSSPQTQHGDAASALQARFPTERELREAKAARERRYGADVSLPQVFPPDQILRRRECLWDEIMYSLGGEYAALVGCNNPFAGQSRWAVPQILAPHAMASSSSSSAAAAFADEAGESALLAEEMEMEAAAALRSLAAAEAAQAALSQHHDDDDEDGGDGDDTTVVLAPAEADEQQQQPASPPHRDDDDGNDDDGRGNGKPSA